MRQRNLVNIIIMHRVIHSINRFHPISKIMIAQMRYMQRIGTMVANTPASLEIIINQTNTIWQMRKMCTNIRYQQHCHFPINRIIILKLETMTVLIIS